MGTDLPTTETSEVTVADSAGVNKLTVNSDGSINVSVSQSAPNPSYAAGFNGLVPPASATDVVTITGSASKVITVTRVVFTLSTTSGSGFAYNLSLLKRSTANSGGTSTTATAVPYDSNDAAATAVVRGYTANPTTGTLVGTIRNLRTSAVTQGSNTNVITFELGTLSSQSIRLRGTNEVLAINLNATSITGPVIGCSIEWTEE
jgi:hypothetical protein